MYKSFLSVKFLHGQAYDRDNSYRKIDHTRNQQTHDFLLDVQGIIVVGSRTENWTIDVVCQR